MTISRSCARTFGFIAVYLFTLVAVLPAMAYPDGRITLVVPFAAGGTTDAIARVIADALGAKLGQTVLVENRPGAGTMVGSTYVVKAKPDGYTLLMASADSLTTGLAMRRNPPFDPLKDFTAIALLTVSTMVVSVNPKVPATNLKELTAYATRTGQPIRYGTGGAGTIMHLTGEMLALETGISLLHVPYRGGAPAVSDAISGQIETLIVGPTSVQAQINAGQLRGLVQTGEIRHPLLPDVPTATDLGLPKFNAMSFFGIVGPAKLPLAVTEKLSTALLAIANDPKVKQQIISVGGQGDPLGPDEFAKFIARDLKQWQDVIAASKIERVD